MSPLFVTGSGTGVGKTYVTALLTRELRAAGRSVRALKPVATGMVPADDPAFCESDPAHLLAAQGLAISDATLAACAPWRFAAPLSPDMAAAAEGRNLKLDDVIGWTRGVAAQTPAPTFVLVEGVGGVMSPIAEDGLNIDLIAALRCPVILVCGSYLGAITHALTAIAALRARGVEFCWLIQNETAGSPVDFNAALSSLARFAVGIPVSPLRYGASALERCALESIIDQMTSVPTLAPPQT
jgi:dethiobiotin synthetase